jgi:uncharacterized protein
MERLVVWSGLDAERWEVAHLSLDSNGVAGTGTQIGMDPIRYRLDYTLEAGFGFVTRRLDVRVQGEAWSRRLELRHDGDGGWSWEVEVDGGSILGRPGAEPEMAEELVAARDCDLGLSPVTNLMPIRRYGLNTRNGSVDIVAAWVSVPDLRLHSYPQRYEGIGRDGEGSVVRFIDRGLSAGFTADLVLDSDGLIEIYPGLARRVKGNKISR